MKNLDKIFKITFLFLVLFIITIALGFQSKEKTIEFDKKIYDTDRPVIIIGDDNAYPPYSYLDENGNPAGFSLDLLKSALENMGFKVEIRLNTWSDTRKALENGEIDLIAGMFYSEERAKQYSFSTKHSVTKGDIFSKKSNVILSIEELRGKKVSVQRNDIVHEYLKDKDLEIEFIERNNVNEALEAVNDGVADYAGVLKLPAHYYIKEEKYSSIISNEIDMVANDYCVVASKENEDLIYIVNGGLEIVKAIGEYDKIKDKWLSVYEHQTIIKRIKDYYWIVLIVLGVFLILFIWTVLLRKMVQKKTKELADSRNKLWESNQELEAAMGQLSATEAELRNHYDLLLKNEEALRKSEARNKALVEAIPDMIFVLDEIGVFKDYQASKDVLYSDPNEFIGKNIADIMPKEIGEIAVKKIKRAIQYKKSQIHNYKMEMEYGTGFYEARIVPVGKREVVAIVRDVTEQYKNKEHIEYLSYHDQLTGLYNRHFFEEELKRLDNKRNLPLCLIMSDVNGLKLINDSFGHKAGDLLLEKVGKVLKETCRNSEIIARIGGDEFIILVPNMNDLEAEKLVNRIQKNCKKEKLEPIELSISFGWSTKKELDEDVHEVFNRAEDYMYKKKLFEGPSMRSKTINAIINTLHEKNKREAKHSERVSEYCVAFAEVLNLKEREIGEMRMAGLLHDIGKVAIKESVLNKPGKLSDEEYEEIKKHPEIGYRILTSVNDMSDMAEIAFCHHERWDGFGYPRGLKEEEIPFSARMVAIVDSFDAMTSERSYRNPMTNKEAAIEIIKNAGTQFDPILAKIFVNEVLKEKVKI